MHMRRILIAAATATASALALAAPAGAVDQLDPYQWRTTSVEPRSNQPYTLRNVRLSSGRNALSYLKRRWGINLGWEGGGTRHSGFGEWTFHKSGGARTPLERGFAVALRDNATGDYVRYGRRAFGINLKWSGGPRHQWEVRPSNGRLALYNTVVRDYLVYGSRTVGINLVWLRDLERKVQRESRVERTASVTLRAQPIVQGYRPFTAEFGRNVRGALLDVRNAFSGVAISFVKPGRSTAECGNPDAVVVLGPRSALTADQRRAAFGSAEPRLPVTFVACVSSTTQLDSVPVNITYRVDG